jgi:hypothetical protein
LAWASINRAIWVARAFLVISLLLIVKVRQPNRPYKMQLLGRLLLFSAQNLHSSSNRARIFIKTIFSPSISC